MKLFFFKYLQRFWISIPSSWLWNLVLCLHLFVQQHFGSGNCPSDRGRSVHPDVFTYFQLDFVKPDQSSSLVSIANKAIMLMAMEASSPSESRWFRAWFPQAAFTNKEFRACTEPAYNHAKHTSSAPHTGLSRSSSAGNGSLCFD